MNTPREKAAVCCHPSGNIYVFGGYFHEALNTIEMKLKEKSKFVILEIVLPKALFSIASVVWKNDIVLFGRFKERTSFFETRIMGHFRIQS